MRVLIVSHFYDPEPVPKPSELAIELRARGHDVQVITGFPNYPSGRLLPGYRLRPYLRERRDGIDVLRVFVVPYHGANLLSRALNYLSFMLSASIAGVASRRPDVIYVWHPPLFVGPAAWLIGALRRTKYVYDVQDIWPDEMLMAGLLREGIAVRLLRRIERFVYAHAAHIVVMTDGARRNLLAKGVPPEKMSVLSHWAYGQASQAPSTPEFRADARNELGPADHFVVTFAGNVGYLQGLDTVLRAAHLVRDEPRIVFRIVGDGAARDDLAALARQLGLTNFAFLPARSPSTTAPILEASDCLLIHLRAGALGDLVLPAKTLNYLAAGRPIVAATTGTVADLIERSKAGLVVPPENPEALAGAIRQVANMPEVERTAMGSRGREYLAQHFARSRIVDELERILVRAAGRFG